MRPVPSRPSGSLPGSRGACPGHQTTTGESGSRSGRTTDSGCLVTSPVSRIRARSPEAPEPIPTLASTCEAPRRSPRTTPRIRAGCSCEAVRATAMASSASSLSATTTSVMIIPMAGLPERRRARTNSAAMALELVSVRSIISAPPRGRDSSEWLGGRRSCPPPGPPVASQHLHRGLRPPGARLVGVGPSVGRPVVDDRVEDLPRQLDLLVLREQGRVPEEHVEDEPLVRLGGGLGERAAVREIHVDVADLHRAAGHLRAEARRDALVGLHPEHQRVLGQLLGGGLAERQVRCTLEDHRHLGHATPEPLPVPQVERHACPAPRLYLELDGGERLGRGGGRDVLLLLVAGPLLAAGPAFGVLTPRG